MIKILILFKFLKSFCEDESSVGGSDLVSDLERSNKRKRNVSNSPRLLQMVCSLIFYYCLCDLLNYKIVLTTFIM